MIRFRRAEATDVPRLVSLIESAYRGEPSRAGWTTEADLLEGRRTGEDEVGPLVRGPRSCFVVAERSEDGELVGCVVLRDEEGEVAYLGMLTVDPKGQAHGVGSELLAEAERVARDERGAKTMRMTVISVREELLRWLRRRGYAETGAREAFPSGDPRFGKPLREDLEFVVLAKAL